MTLSDMVARMCDERVEGADAMLRQLGGDTVELVDALIGSQDLMNSAKTGGEQMHVLIGVLGVGVAIGYYRALQQCDELLGLRQSVTDRQRGVEPC